MNLNFFVEEWENLNLEACYKYLFEYNFSHALDVFIQVIRL